MVSVSVIVPCYNIEWVLENLANNIYQIDVDGLDVEFIFVDDGSTDETFNALKRSFPNFLVIKTDNQGLGATRNLAVSHAQGRYIQLLDADDGVEPYKISSQYNFALKNNLDIVYSDWRMSVVTPSGRNDEKKYAQFYSDSLLDALLQGWWVPPNAYLISRQLYLDSGGCNGLLKNTAEDFELGVRLATCTSRVGYYPGFLSTYYRYTDVVSMSRKNKRDFWVGWISMLHNTETLLCKKFIINKKRQHYLAARYYSVALNTVHDHPDIYKIAIQQIKRLDPRFKPNNRYRALLAQLFGLEKTDVLLHYARRTLGHFK